MTCHRFRGEAFSCATWSVKQNLDTVITIRNSSLWVEAKSIDYIYKFLLNLILENNVIPVGKRVDTICQP